MMQARSAHLSFVSIIKDEIRVGHPANGFSKAPAGKGFVICRKPWYRA